MRRPFVALSLGYLFTALRSVFVIGKDDSIPLIIELISARACPAGILLLLRMAAAGSLAASGLAMGLAHAPSPPMAGLLQGGLATHAAVHLVGACKPQLLSKSLPMLAATQSPRVLHLAALSTCVGDVLADRRVKRAAPPPPSSSPTATPVAALLLDIDGTLTMTDDIYFDAFKQLLQPLGIDVDGAWYAEHVHGKTDAQVFGRLLPEADDDEVREWGHRKDALFCELYKQRSAASGPPLVAGLAAALEAASARGLRCIAVTNAPRGAAEACIESLRQAIPAASILDKTIVVGAECAQAKPHPEPYLRGARMLGVSPADCVVFEDSASGVKAGIAAGVRAVVGVRTSLDESALRAHGAFSTLADWREFTTDFLDELSALPRPTARADTGAAGAREKAVAAALRALRLPPLALLTTAVAMSAAPAACVDGSLFCNGDTAYAAAATRAAGAALVAMAAASHASTAAHMNARQGSQTKTQTTDSPLVLASPAQWALTMALLASSSVHVHTVVRDGHALCRSARRLLLTSGVATGVAAVASADLHRRSTSRGAAD